MIGREVTSCVQEEAVGLDSEGGAKGKLPFLPVHQSED